jgi:P27 family predicted phage terminase small subunit
MAKGGQRPVPTQLKLLRGNPSKTAIKKHEPQPRRDPLPTDAPAMLTGYAREEWDRIVPELRYLRLMTRVDTQPLAAYCKAYSIWRTAVETFDNAGQHFSEMNRLIVRKANGDPMQNPLIRIIRDAAADMARLADAFGFTPAARTRLTTPPEGAGDESKFGELLSG